MVNSTHRLNGNMVCHCNGPKYPNLSLANVHLSYSLLDKCIVSSNLETSKFSSPVAIYHQNIQGLRCKTDELLNFLEPNLPHVLCISEHHLNQLELGLIQLDNYTLGASYCRNSLKKGGVYLCSPRFKLQYC
jgi:hypothetical protein